MLTHRGGFTIIMSLGLRYCTFACHPNDTYKNNATSDKIYFKNADRLKNLIEEVQLIELNETIIFAAFHLHYNEDSNDNGQCKQ